MGFGVSFLISATISRVASGVILASMQSTSRAPT